MATQWEFIEDKGREPSWSWRCVLLGGGHEAASPRSFPSYGLAVRDAISHGFQPAKHHWAVITKLGTTRFQPGQDPASWRKGS